jgi:hypothetical protein
MMDGDDLRELELAIDTNGALSGEDSHRLVVEVRRLTARNDLLSGRIDAARMRFERERIADREGLPVDWRWLATEMAKALGP